MNDDYKDKLMELVVDILSNVSAQLTDDEKEEFAGVGPLAMLVSAHMIYLAKEYTPTEIGKIADLASIIARGVLDSEDADAEDLSAVDVKQKKVLMN